MNPSNSRTVAGIALATARIAPPGPPGARNAHTPAAQPSTTRQEETVVDLCSDADRVQTTAIRRRAHPPRHHDRPSQPSGRRRRAWAALLAGMSLSVPLGFASAGPAQAAAPLIPQRGHHYGRERWTLRQRDHRPVRPVNGTAHRDQSGWGARLPGHRGQRPRRKHLRPRPDHGSRPDRRHDPLSSRRSSPAAKVCE